MNPLATDCDKVPPAEGSQAAARQAACEFDIILVYHIFLPSYSEASKPRTTQTSDHDKFLPLDSPLVPFSIPAWSAGLQAVDQSPSHLVQTSKISKHYGHYAFPNPGLFVSSASDEMKARSIESWLLAHDAWFMRLEREPSLAMSNQNWHTFLTIDLDVQETGKTKAANRRREILGLLMAKSKLDPEVKMRSTSRGPLVWQDQEYPRGVLPPDDVVRQILWELYEINFLHELLSLDHHACANLNLSDTVQLLERQIMISQCFPLNSFRPVTIPSENCGLAADDFEERFRFITALLQVMKSWRGNKPVLFGVSTDNLHDFSQRAAMDMENRVARYYCQQFFNYFGRAAQIPHRLFATKYS